MDEASYKERFKPINKHGAQAIENMRRINAILVKDHAYLIADNPQRSFSYLQNKNILP